MIFNAHQGYCILTSRYLVTNKVHIFFVCMLFKCAATEVCFLLIRTRYHPIRNNLNLIFVQ